MVCLWVHNGLLVEPGIACSKSWLTVCCYNCTGCIFFQSLIPFQQELDIFSSSGTVGKNQFDSLTRSFCMQNSTETITFLWRHWKMLELLQKQMFVPKPVCHPGRVTPVFPLGKMLGTPMKCWFCGAWVTEAFCLLYWDMLQEVLYCSSPTNMSNRLFQEREDNLLFYAQNFGFLLFFVLQRT